MSTFKVDPALLGLPSSSTRQQESAAPTLLIDPALATLEQAVNDVRRGKVKLADLEPERSEGRLAHDLASNDAVGLMDEEFDPALREIVNSLTNAQQSSELSGTNLTQAQAQAAIDAHLSEDADHGMALKTLEDLERAGFGMLDGQFTSHSDPFAIHAPHAETSAAGAAAAAAAASSTATAAADGREPRRRGRPKGSKNKPKPGQPAPMPPPPKIPKKRGRPPKVHTAEELAEIEQRKTDKKAGITGSGGGGGAGGGSGRRKGRPRKFPGYLVREMRLKKNRAEYRELLRNYQSQNPDDHDPDQSQGQEVVGDGGEFWTDGMEQDILAAVEGLDEGEAGGGGGGHADHLHAHAHAHDNDVPSSRAFEEGGEMEMRRVFGLPAEHDDGEHGHGQGDGQ